MGQPLRHLEPVLPKEERVVHMAQRMGRLQLDAGAYIDGRKAQAMATVTSHNTICMRLSFLYSNEVEEFVAAMTSLALG